MNRICLTLTIFSGLLGLMNLSASLAEAGKIEAIEGKRYTISKQNGPWMIMVATLHEPEDKYKVEGKSPAQAAQDLVIELRQLGIPAYSFKRDKMENVISTVNRRGVEQNRKYKIDEEYCVVAGNYQSCDDKLAQETRDYIKKLKPKCLMDGGIYHATKDRPSPLRNSFLTVNPLLSPEELALNKHDPEIMYMNADMNEMSLLKHSGKYSVVVATFAGKSIVQKDGTTSKSGEYDSKEAADRIDQMYQDARILCQMLREKGYDAYVFHDYYKSIVTIGAFESENSPEISKIQQMFAAQYKHNAGSGKMELLGQSFMLPSSKKNDPTRMVVFDPQPRVMQVPYYR
jgi:hypothetical protein